MSTTPGAGIGGAPGYTPAQIRAAQARAAALERTTGKAHQIAPDGKGNIIVVRTSPHGIVKPAPGQHSTDTVGGKPEAVVDAKGRIHAVTDPTYGVTISPDGTVNHHRVTPKPTTPKITGGNRPDNRGGPLGPDDPVDTRPGVDKRLKFDFGISPDVNNVIDPSILDQGASQLPTSYADRLAALQYDSKINDVGALIKHQPGQAAQNIHDIGHWYDQVKSAVETARTRASDVGSKAADGVSSATAAILASLGGAANPGASTIGAAGASASAMQKQLGENETNFLGDLAPLLTQEAAGAKTNEQNRQGNYLADLNQQLADLKGEKGNARANNLMDITKENNNIAQQNLMNRLNLLGQNNSARQGNFQNALNTFGTNVAAALTGAQTKSILGATSGKFQPWNKLDLAQQQDLINSAIGQVVDGQNGLLYDPVTAMKKAQGFLVSKGYAAGANPGILGGLRAGISRANAIRAHIDALNAQKTS